MPAPWIKRRRRMAAEEAAKAAQPVEFPAAPAADPIAVVEEEPKAKEVKKTPKPKAKAKTTPTKKAAPKRSTKSRKAPAATEE